MYRILIHILFLSLFFSADLFSQNNWLNRAGGLTHDEALDVCHDQNGNYYVTGYFTNAANFGSLSITGFGFSDIFIAKYSPNGQPLWVKNAGGLGPDRGYSIYCDQNGNLFVTGYFTGPATFETTTLNSNGNSQDVFIAKYDTNGNLQWVTSVGGNLGDTGYGITSDNLGNVIVTGQYKGVANFGSTTLTSMIDPNTNQFAFDIFVVKYDANGNFLWVQNGAAEYDDRGMDLATDDANNIFVVGQYSDTITIDNTYNNQVMNAGFLLKLDENGQEQFFKSMSGVQVLVYSIAIDNSNNVFITGDFRGTLAIVGSPSTYVTAGYYNKIFVTKFDNSGNVLWAEADASDNEVTSKSIDLDVNGDAYITGLFKCRFHEYSDLYGDAIFYSAGYRDVFITKYSSTGTREWMRHFGGPKDDYCSGIAVADVDFPIIVGGFENHFSVPNSGNFLNITGNSINYSVQPASFCSDNNYNQYRTVNAAGQKDIFISSPLELNREPFDYFYHSTFSSCIRDTMKICIENCLDTVEACGNKVLTPNFFNASPGRMGSNGIYINAILGPEYDILWSTGSIRDTALARHTGIYYAEISRKDGCMSHTDSVYFIKHGFPEEALISDDMGFNTLSPPNAYTITFCYPDTVQITASNVFQADTFYWSGPAMQYVNDSVFNTSVSGLYTINTFNSFGCPETNTVNVVVYNPPFDSLELSTYLVNPVFEAADTVELCEGQCYEIAIHDTVPPITHTYNIPSTQVEWVMNGPGGGGGGITGNSHKITICPSISGWYTLSDTLTKICGDTIKYYSSRTYYVNVLARPNVSLNITNNGALICPGDTAWAVATANPSTATLSWSGSGIIENYVDSVRVIVTSNLQQINVTATVYDTITGCSNYISGSVPFYTIPPPIIWMNPSDGIICPYDSILLSAPNGISWQWVGPNGNFIGNTQQIYVDVPGYYHCIVEDTIGCQQTSNFVEAKEYNTPYLDVFPSNHICSNGNTTLTVIASNSALIQWQPPLIGNSVTQIVNSPGTYVCNITLCGITTVDSITVTQSNTPANIYSNDSVICPGDTLLLYANGGMVDYLWNPGGSHDNVLYVTQPGSYTVMTTDAYGCFGNSSPFVVTAASQPAPPVSSDTLICAGQSIILNATATNSVLWFTSATSTNPIFTGNNYTTPVITNNTSYFIQTYDSVCGSVRDEIEINVYQSSTTPQIFGDTTLCEGQLLNLYSNIISGADYFWTGPNGITSDSSSLYYFPIDTSYAGIYTLYYSDTSCTSPVVNVNVSVNQIPQPYIMPDSNLYLCPGDSYILIDTVGYPSYVWSPGNQNGNSITVTTPGFYYVTATENGCSGISNGVTVSNANPALDPITNDITVCENTSGILNATASGTITWYDENMNLIGNGNSYTTLPMDTTTLFYVLNTNSNGCASNYVPVWVIVPPLDSVPPVYYVPVCEGGDLYLYTMPLPGANYSWTGPNNFSSNISDPVISNATQINGGVYTVIISLNGCSSLPGSVTVDIYPNPVAPVISGDPIYCENDTAFLYASVNLINYNVWYAPSGWADYNTNGFWFPVSMADNGNVILYVSDSNNCYDSSLYAITVNPLPYASLNISSDICAGGNIYLNAFTNFTAASITWTSDGTFSSLELADSVINAQSSNTGYYVAELSLNNCFYSDSVYITVSDYPVIELGEDTSLCPGGEVLFSLNPNYIYSWQDGSMANEFTALDSGLVYVTASVYPGCSTSDSVFVNLLECSSLFPNVFSPNGDGENDVFNLMNNEGVQSFQVTIYDRWGRIVYRITQLNQGWNGLDMQTNELPEGVYYWIASVVNYFGETEQHHGYVHLFR